ncbi:2-oxo acid dehydrogenase subunit E2 [Sinimarinibacterium flocculans]|uniref:2-oxo acid dehydrogenase subunit E2 n=1 Tax=Sinimarinibacterium flocculans TaxID=985250 RepID=UPI002492104B|nr:2-oxo acid dehydrogenase subunit E2 [Sinimarinibacterium flocculans]
MIGSTNIAMVIDMASLVALAHGKGLPMSEMSGASFSVSSLGSVGGTGFTPIINLPEVAILGLTRTRLAPRPTGSGTVEWRSMLPVSLSYDHRVINGADAARFCGFVGTAMESRISVRHVAEP